MFQEYYGFTRVPFSKTMPTADLFPTAGQKELTARLMYLIRERGFGLVTGEIGSGKSTAVRAFAANLDFNRYIIVYLANPTTGMTGLYRDRLLALGHEPPFSRPRMVAALRAAFEDLWQTKHRAPVILLDEAQLSYDKHQLRVAGASTNTLFTDDALARVYDYTKGIPRRINQACTPALMAGLIDQKTIIDESTLRKAIAELDHE